MLYKSRRDHFRFGRQTEGKRLVVEVVPFDPKVRQKLVLRMGFGGIAIKELPAEASAL